MIEKEFTDIQVIIARTLEGTARNSELVELKEWISGSESNRQYFEQVRNIWNESDLHFNQTDILEDLALDKVLNRIQKRNRSLQMWEIWQRMAAVLLLPVLLGSFFLIIKKRENKTAEKVNYNEIYAAFGTRSAIILSDSTHVWLNSGSSLRYPDQFDSDTREVYLKGEAYFEVKSDAAHPFVVSTENMQVKALGTKFNVLEYNAEEVTSVTLISGGVKVKGAERSGSQMIDLKPGQHLELNKHTGDMTIINGDTYKYIAWTEGKLVFRNDPMDEVLMKIAQLFNVDIELQDDTLKNYRYRATFEEENLDDILKLLKLSSPVDYREVERHPLPDGSFSRKKIIVFALVNKPNK